MSRPCADARRLPCTKLPTITEAGPTSEHHINYNIKEHLKVIDVRYTIRQVFPISHFYNQLHIIYTENRLRLFNMSICHGMIMILCITFFITFYGNMKIYVIFLSLAIASSGLWDILYPNIHFHYTIHFKKYLFLFSI